MMQHKKPEPSNQKPTSLAMTEKEWNREMKMIFREPSARYASNHQMLVRTSW